MAITNELIELCPNPICRKRLTCINVVEIDGNQQFVCRCTNENCPYTDITFIKKSKLLFNDQQLITKNPNNNNLSPGS